VLPFVERFDADYIFFGNEFSCDDEEDDPEGFRANFCYDQTAEWTRQLTAVMGIMTDGRVEVGSLVGNLYELGLVKILHTRYPILAQLQTSCFSETKYGKRNKWCGQCNKCANTYLFFKALGIDTVKAGFKMDMFRAKNKKFYPLFDDNAQSYQLGGVVAEEEALAFYMSAEKGAKGHLIEKFKKTRWYAKIKADLNQANKEYFGIHESISVPERLRTRLKRIFEETFSGRFKTKDFREKKV
jgi:hypothetical protein